MNGLLDALGLKNYLPAAWTKRGPIVPVLRFSGAIGVVTPLRPGLSLSTSAAAIDKAFAMSGAKAVAIQINSPGGSAVQSTLIYKRIRDLAAEKNLKVYVFAEDVAADVRHDDRAGNDGRHGALGKTELPPECWRYLLASRYCEEGPTGFGWARAMEEAYGLLARAGTQSALLERMQSRRELYDVIRYHDYEALDATIARSVLPGD